MTSSPNAARHRPGTSNGRASSTGATRSATAPPATLRAMATASLRRSQAPGLSSRPRAAETIATRTSLCCPSASHRLRSRAIAPGAWCRASSRTASLRAVTLPSARTGSNAAGSSAGRTNRAARAAADTATWASSEPAYSSSSASTSCGRAVQGSAASLACRNSGSASRLRSRPASIAGIAPIIRTAWARSCSGSDVFHTTRSSSSVYASRCRAVHRRTYCRATYRTRRTPLWAKRPWRARRLRTCLSRSVRRAVSSSNTEPSATTDGSAASSPSTRSPLVRGGSSQRSTARIASDSLVAVSARSSARCSSGRSWPRRPSAEASRKASWCRSWRASASR